ncbi:ATP-binding cassette domain-containing protein [Exiguobacterium sp.]|uniref:ATP-binding cassette domain-containing protein n=1 Tax=Exiguobacterium sp. TaxID=44751 RepID=UPI00263A5B83|nr:ATP-binding cassette domain-containing protein [Exiguobacterium sp.]MCC5893239.1 ATP-binding cassette domain-containing protein [Exiguobacterium sp.]
MHWLSSEDTRDVEEWMASVGAKAVRLDEPLAGRVASLVIGDDALQGSEVVALLQIDHLMNKRFDECSSGERQLVRIAHALTNRPQALVLFEPFRHLDRYRREHLTMLLERLAKLNVKIAFTERARETGTPPSFSVISSRGEGTIDVRDVSYRHPLQPVYAVEHVTFASDGPGLTAFIGSNGSGKSTLLELMAKSVRPLQGKLKLSSRPVYLPPEEEYGPFPEAPKRRVEQLKAVLVSEAPLFLLDEPTVGLTDQERAGFLNALVEKSRTACLICATHDAAILAAADRIVALSNGRVVFYGTYELFLERSMVWSHSSSLS